jgi:predicted PurR-regulated permease PerM
MADRGDRQDRNDENAASGEDAAFFRKVRWVKIIIWAFFLGLVYILRHFFALIFLTFIISYIARNVVAAVSDLAGGRPAVRKTAVVATFVVFVLLVYASGRFIVPNIYDQARTIYATVADLSAGGEGKMDNLILRVYGGIRFLFFKATDEYDREFADFRRQRREDRTQSGRDGFLEEARAIREAFHEEQVLERGTAAYWNNKGTEEYQKEFDRELYGLVERMEFEPNRERLIREKETELIRTLTPKGYEKAKEIESDWDAYVKSEIMRDLLKEARRTTEVRLKYEELFRLQYIRTRGEEAMAALDGSAEREQLFKEFYENLPDERKDYGYEKFAALEKARDQEEYQKILGDADLNEEKAAALFRERKVQEYAAELMHYDFIANARETSIGGILPDVAVFLAKAIEYIFTFGYMLVLSVFFSFIIVWDIPKLRKTVRRLEDSRISDFYREIVPGLASFGSLMGRAFQAQAIIAIVNTLLTLAAMVIFDVQNRAFLCTIVFFCSFIPVLGVFISSVPIALMALTQTGGGIIKALEMIAAITIIHFIEATILNPKIMGDMLKLHPLLVLIILFVGEHLFGLWGLLLGVPVCVYIFRYVILRKDETPESAAPAPAPGA